MAYHLLRFFFLGKHKFSDTIINIFDSEIGKRLSLIWDERTCFIIQEDDMLKSINNRAYDFIFHDKQTVETSAIVTVNKSNRVHHKNEYDKPIVKDTQLCSVVQSPMLLLKDQIVDKEKMCYVCLPGLYNVTHQLITNTIQKNFYAKKASIMTDPNLIQEMHNIHLPLNRKLTTTYVNLLDSRVILKEVIRNLLEHPPVDHKRLSPYVFTLEPSQLLLTILKKQGKGVDNDKNSFDRVFLSCLNRIHVLYLLQQCQDTKRANDDSSKNGICLYQKFALFNCFYTNIRQLTKVMNVIEVKNNFYTTLNTKISLVDYFTRNIFRDYSRVIRSLLGVARVNCSRIDHDDIIERKLILDINKQAFDDLEKQLKEIKIIDKVVERDETEDEDNEIKFKNVQSVIPYLRSIHKTNKALTYNPSHNQEAYCLKSLKNSVKERWNRKFILYELLEENVFNYSRF